MTPHQVALQKVQAQTTTHACPECTKLTYCAMEAGHSANLCWCLLEPIATDRQAINEGRCVCKACLNGSPAVEPEVVCL